MSPEHRRVDRGNLVERHSLALANKTKFGKFYILFVLSFITYQQWGYFYTYSIKKYI